MNARTSREVRIGAVVDYVLGKPVKQIIHDWNIHRVTLARLIAESDFQTRREVGYYGAHYGPNKRLMKFTRGNARG